MGLPIGMGDASEGHISVGQGVEDRAPEPGEGIEEDFVLLLLAGHFSVAEGNL